MKKILASTIILTLLLLASCNSSPTANIQGVYEIDKTLLKAQLQTEMGDNPKKGIGIVNAILTNAIMEFHIQGDSISGIFEFIGETIVFNTQIEEKDGKLIVPIKNSEAVITPTKDGFLFTPPHLDVSFQFNKTDRQSLSANTQKAINLQNSERKRNKELNKVDNEVGFDN